MNEIINGYILEAPFQNQNAGFSRWTYASRDGYAYFIKEFMNPIYPCSDSISDAVRENRINECRIYEEKKKTLYDAINRAADGNIVRILDFFRYKSHYYITTELIYGENLSFEQICYLDFDTKILLCKSLIHSVSLLHRNKIVHSDLKDSNIIIKRTATGRLVPKIIDFDCSFFEYDPPTDESDLGGDQVYLSPEGCRFICGEDVKLSTKMDVFAIGLLCHQILTGKLPYYDTSEYDYIHEYVLDGNKVIVSQYVPNDLTYIIEKMLLCEPDQRCDLDEAVLYFDRYFSLPNETQAISSVEYADEAGCLNISKIHTMTNWFKNEEL